MLYKNYTPQPSEIYCKNARLVQYSKLTAILYQ